MPGTVRAFLFVLWSAINSVRFSNRIFGATRPTRPACEARISYLPDEESARCVRKIAILTGKQKGLIPHRSALNPLVNFGRNLGANSADYGMEEVVGSIPTRSTMFSITCRALPLSRGGWGEPPLTASMPFLTLYSQPTLTDS